MKAFGEVLVQVMDEKGVSQKKLADVSGVSQSYVSRVISGYVKDPTFAKACAMLDALGMDLDEFAKRQEVEYAVVELQGSDAE